MHKNSLILYFSKSIPLFKLCRLGPLFLEETNILIFLFLSHPFFFFSPPRHRPQCFFLYFSSASSPSSIAPTSTSRSSLLPHLYLYQHKWRRCGLGYDTTRRCDVGTKGMAMESDGDKSAKDLRTMERKSAVGRGRRLW